MTERKDEAKKQTSQSETAPQGVSSDKTGKASAKDDQIEPTLTRYFGDPKVSAAEFLKALRRKNLRGFSSTDQDAAEKMMAAHDSDGERLWALVSQGNSHNAIDLWIWDAIRRRLKSKFGDQFDADDHDGYRILRSLVRQLDVDEKQSRNWVGLAANWVHRKKRTPLLEIILACRSFEFPEADNEKSKKKKPHEVASDEVLRAKAGSLRLAIGVAEIGDRFVKEAEEEKNRERRISNDLRHRLDDSRTKIERLQSDLESARTMIAAHEATIEQLQQTLSAERQHWGHDLTEAKAEQKLLLGERLGPLLEDAIDALEIDPPAPGTAMRRVKAALAVIEEAKE